MPINTSIFAFQHLHLIKYFLPSPSHFNVGIPIHTHTLDYKVPTKFILDQVGGVESISGIHFDPRDRLGGLQHAPLTPCRARVKNAPSRDKVARKCLKMDSELQTDGRNGFYALILV